MLTLRRDEDRFASEIAQAVLTDIPESRRMPLDLLYEAIRKDLRRALTAISERRLPNEQEIAESAASAARLARMGFTVEHVLHGRRVSMRRARELLREAAVKRGLDASAQIELVHRIWEWADAIQISDADVHRTAVLEMNGGGDEDRSWFVRALLQGPLLPGDVARRATGFGLLPTMKYMALRVRAGEGSDMGALERTIAATGSDDHFAVLSTILDDGELCAIVRKPPYVSPPAIAGLGPETELTALGKSFELATRALETGAALGREGVVSIDELSLRPAVLAEEHLGDRLIARYLEPLYELGEFGTTLETTVRVYLERGMRIEESAKALFVHPNTLRHRIDRFQQLTGANLRRTEDVLELWWALERRALTQSDKRGAETPL
ncbi:MAG: helix-turn-helix domain-containing protein [Actinomycetota bacterium]|nr:helix-turn-helix domain-containing protein [Actinomycetota bacterium]